MVTASAEASRPKPRATSRTRVEISRRYKGAKHPNQQHPDNEIITRKIDVAAAGLPEYVPKHLTNLR
ncbi:MAG: hypothetical protein WAZ77_04630 [Candidatus Nitrosopolaris sp.]|jgi:hypothetical protein